MEDKGLESQTSLKENEVLEQDQDKDSDIRARVRAQERADALLSHKVDESFDTAMSGLEFTSEEVKLEAIQRIEGAHHVFQELYEEYPTTVGKAVSKKEREAKNVHDSTFVYGEIHFKTFAFALEKIKVKYGGLVPGSGGTFVDIGSGSGKAIFAALLLHEFHDVIGIEFLSGLHKLSLEILDRWNVKKHKLHVSDKKRDTKVHFVCGDALHVDWSDADVAFANSTCFSPTMMAELGQIAEKMKPGSFFITFTKRLPSKLWQVLEYERYLMSWGEATVFIHKRIETVYRNE